MKILIDIGHPAHVHYFRNAINIIQNNGHKVVIVARNKDVVVELLNFYNFQFISRGKGKNSKFGKLAYLFITDIKLFFIALKFKPDLYLSFSSPYLAQIAALLRKPHIAINDTEHTDKMHKWFTYPFSSCILTPMVYSNPLGSKHILFDAIMEAFYLAPSQFTPNDEVFDFLKIPKEQKFVLLRFVSWKAHHDFGQSGLDLATKLNLIKLLEKKFKVFISSEAELSDEFLPYKISIPAQNMHSVLFYASAFIGESATMASESTLLGTPAVYINSLPLMGYLKLEQDSGLLKHFNSNLGILEYVKEFIETFDFIDFHTKSLNMQASFINPTNFLVWFLENYPESFDIMKRQPNYQYRFK